MANYTRTVFGSMILIGYGLTAVGCVAIALGLVGVFSLDQFAYGLSSGIRIVGSVAIAGCLLTAIGYGVLENSKKQ
jgi:hypothetical protein